MIAVAMLTNTVIMGFSSEQLAEWLPWMYETIEGDQYIKQGYGRYIHLQYVLNLSIVE